MTTKPDEPPAQPRPPPFPESLCHRCAAHRYVVTRTSTFIHCAALAEKYPRQPVTSCPAFQQQR